MDVKVNCDWQYYQQAVTKIWEILDIETYEQAQGKDVAEWVATLKQQRDDLLEACKPFARLADMIPTPNAPDPQWRKFNTAIRALPLDRYREAKAAIAKCET